MHDDTELARYIALSLFLFWVTHCSQQVYANVSGEPPLDEPMIDVSSNQFYGEGYDDSDKRIPDMTIINRQLGMTLFSKVLSVSI